MWHQRVRGERQTDRYAIQSEVGYSLVVMKGKEEGEKNREAERERKRERGREREGGRGGKEREMRD